MQHPATTTRACLIWLCFSFIIIDNVLAVTSPKSETGAPRNSIQLFPKLNAESRLEIPRDGVTAELVSDFIAKHSARSPNFSDAIPSVQKEVRIVYLVPSDKSIRQEYLTGTAVAIGHLQAFYQSQLGSGFAFSLHSPVVEVFQTSHSAAFYSTGANSSQIGFWTSVLGDGFALSGGGFDDPNNRWIYYVDADPLCGQVTGGTNGVALLPSNDLRGLSGQANLSPCVGQPPDLGGVCRWVGGLGHELGHAFGLPHPPGCDQGTCSDFARHSLMYLGYIDYPNTYFLDADKTALLGTGFFSVQSPLEFSPDCMCRVSLNPIDNYFSMAGGTGSLNIACSVGCQWKALTDVEWIRATSGSSGSGNSVFSYSVDGNLTRTSRQGTITVEGHIYTVVQDGGVGDNCFYVISPSSNSFPATGGSGAFQIFSEARCSWQASTTNSFITITSNSAGIGNGVITYSLAQNPGPLSRKGKITIAGREFIIKQKPPN